MHLSWDSPRTNIVEDRIRTGQTRTEPNRLSVTSIHIPADPIYAYPHRLSSRLVRAVSLERDSASSVTPASVKSIHLLINRSLPFFSRIIIWEQSTLSLLRFSPFFSMILQISFMPLPSFLALLSQSDRFSQTSSLDAYQTEQENSVPPT